MKHRESAATVLYALRSCGRPLPSTPSEIEVLAKLGLHRDQPYDEFGSDYGHGMKALASAVTHMRMCKMHFESLSRRPSQCDAFARA